MTREDIYDHLAKVYLGKRNKTEEKKKKEFNAWLLINLLTTVIIFSSAFYGLTAFLTHKKDDFKEKVIFSLHNGPIRVDYNFRDSYPPVKTFSLTVPEVNIEKYHKLQFSIRAKEEGAPGIVKIVLRNKRNEVSYYYVQGVGLNWREFIIPLEEFSQITDFSSLSDISFVLESWNVDSQKGIILIDNISFGS